VGRTVIPWALVAAGLAIGTATDTAPDRPPLELGGYRVLAADFHSHPAPLSGSSIAAWDMTIEAQRQGLDVIAITPQNGALAGRIGRWFAERTGGPIVIAGEEIHGPRYHMIALGAAYLSWRLPAREAIDEIHRQGGVAIAAHPVSEAWPEYDDATARLLDGTEVAQPIVYVDAVRAEELVQFWKRSGAAAIGSSDWHGLGPLGLCRTYVFVRDASADGVLEAIRARRTVVRLGENAYGDPALVGFAPQLPPAPARPSPASGVLTLAGLLALVLWKR
jgi:hypothetical protein